MVNYNLPASQGEVDAILDLPPVVSVGEALRNGERVMVVGVRSESALNNPNIPSTLGGLPVVVEVEDNPGFAAARPPLAPPGDIPTAVSGTYIEKFRPVPPGVSIGHVDVTAGTSSFLMTDGNTVYMMSNNHVLAKKNNAEPGDPIVQPGTVDGGVPQNDKVGGLADFVPLADSGNAVDLAWFEPDADVTTFIISTGEPTTEPVDPEPGDTVTIIGRTSGPREFTVDKTNAAVEVGEERRRFADQFRLDGPLQGGDSGCPVVIETEDGMAPAGIGYSSTDDNGWCMYARNVVSETGFDFLALEDAPAPGGGGVGGGTLVAAGLLLFFVTRD